MKHLSFLKKAAAAVVSAAMLAASLAIPSAAAENFENANSAVRSITAGWNLGNALDSCGEWIGLYTDGKPQNYETAWNNPVTTKKLITAVKNAGFDAVRIPVTWAEHIDSKGNIDKEWLDRVQEVADYVISQDMYCVLNVHHDAGADGWLKASADCYKKNSDKFAGLWKNIAVRFRDYGEKLIFEGFNEMLDSQNSWSNAGSSDAYKAVNDFNRLFVDTVRKTGGNNAERNLMVQVYAASCAENDLKGFTLPKDTAKDHLIIHVHNYDPQAFTSSDATWTTMTDKWGSDSDKAAFDKLFARLGKFSEQQGAPLVVGEFAADFKDNDDSRKAYAAYFVTSAAKYGIKCFWWDTGEMALFNRNSCTVTHPDIVKALTKYTADKTSSGTKASSSDKLPAPTLKAVKSTGKLTLKWTAVDGADSYVIYKYDAKTKKYAKFKTVSGTSYTIRSPKSGSYRFAVCAVKKIGGKSTNGERSKAVNVTV